MPTGKSTNAAPVAEVLRRLRAEYPEARCSLDFTNAYELLVATILSAQCTDVRVNQVTPALFRKYPDAAALAKAAPGDLEELIKSTGFFNAKAKSLRGAALAIVESHGGEVPRTMEALHALPGVGRKTANVVLGNVFGEPGGVVVDTHVGRLARRLGLSRNDDPEKVEEDLNRKIPPADWVFVSHALILHGRRTCTSRNAFCDSCLLADLCPKKGVAPAPKKRKAPR